MTSSGHKSILKNCLWVENNPLWIDFGIAKNKGYLAVNEMHQRRDSEKSKAIKYFHLLTGYNKVFSLSGYSKKNSCKT